MSKLKTYRTFKTACKKNPDNLPIVKVGELFIVGCHALDEVTILTPTGSHESHITMRALAAIGNGNYATPDKARRPANFKGHTLYSDPNTL